MPPPADPRRWRIIESMVTVFTETSFGSTYFYPPDQVAPIEPPLLQYLEARPKEDKTVYGIWVEDEDSEERTTGRIDLSMRVFIDVATRYKPEITDPFAKADGGQISEEEIRTGHIADVMKVIWNQMSIGGGTQFGGLFENWWMLGSDYFQMRATAVPGWVATQFETRVKYFSKPGDATLP